MRFSLKNYLPIFLLVFTFLLRLFILYLLPHVYVIDELIITSISELPVKEIYAVVKSEPHPILHYTFLHFLNLYDPLKLRVLLMFISNILVGLIYLYGLKIKVIQKLELQNLFLVLFSSFSFLVNTTYLRVYIFSAPAAILFFLLLLQYRELCSISEQRRVFIKILLLHLFLLFTGYIYFVLCLPFVFYVLIKEFNNDRTWALKLSTIWAFSIILYCMFIGWDQIIGNLGRFSWMDNQINNLLYIITASHFGYFLSINSFLYLGPAIAALFIFIRFFRFLKNTYIKSWILAVVAVFVFYVVLDILLKQLHVYIRARYFFPLFLVYLYLVIPPIKSRVIIILITFLSLTFSFIGYYYDVSAGLNHTLHLRQYFETRISKDQHYVFMSNSPFMSSVYSVTLLKDYNNVDHRILYDSFADYSSITADLLYLEALTIKDEDNEGILYELSTEITSRNIVFFNEYLREDYDPNSLILNSLLASCENRSVNVYPDASMELYYFSGCDFFQ